ncbi:MAG TPA: MerR family transcriptional regulator [Acidimicrobiales bacterium]
MKVLSIGQLAEAAGVHVETIRYYERRGLLPEPPRSAGGYRQYGPDDLWRLEFVGRAKALGFTLTEVGELLQEDTRNDVGSVRAIVLRKLEAIEARQRELAGVRVRLERLADICADPDSDDCGALRLTR